MISIRPFSAGDTEAICTLILRIQIEEFQVPITRADQPDLDNIPGVYQQGKGNFWVALHEKEVVGTIAAIDFGGDMLALRKMFVHAGFRGKEFGTAQLLLDTMLRWCAEKQVKAIFLGTLEKFVAARKFYDRNGFEVIRKQDLPPNFPRMPLDDVFYKFEIVS
jgi:N-acetylglutamate synthase-like GNAT family acetyltransferase